MVKPDTKLSCRLPPLIFGAAAFNYQFNVDPFTLDSKTVIERALAHGIRAFDTSPYYGPSEEILGNAFATDFVTRNYPREHYYLLTKVGRISADCFDYSPEWVRHSVERSCKRLRTHYLDVVYCHDVEFVSKEEVLGAVKELRLIRDEGGTVRYIGISGYPVSVLCELAEQILHETGEPLDAVMSYANFTLQNTKLQSEGLPRLLAAGVDVVPNASLLSMGLLRSQGPPVGGMGDWHPAPHGLRQAVRAASQFTDSHGEKLEVVAIRFALENWLHEGPKVGVMLNPLASSSIYQSESFPHQKFSVSVMGVSNMEELDEIIRVWRSVLDGLGDDLNADIGTLAPSGAVSDYDWSSQRRQRMRTLAKSVRSLLGDWVDFEWPSPPPRFINQPHDQNGKQNG